MRKKTYMQPIMQIVQVEAGSQLLAGSVNGVLKGYDYGGDWDDDEI